MKDLRVRAKVPLIVTRLSMGTMKSIPQENGLYFWSVVGPAGPALEPTTCQCRGRHSTSRPLKEPHFCLTHGPACSGIKPCDLQTILPNDLAYAQSHAQASRQRQVHARQRGGNWAWGHTVSRVTSPDNSSSTKAEQWCEQASNKAELHLNIALLTDVKHNEMPPDDSCALCSGRAGVHSSKHAWSAVVLENKVAQLSPVRGRQTSGKLKHPVSRTQGKCSMLWPSTDVYKGTMTSSVT